MKRTKSIISTALTLGLALTLQAGCAGTAAVAEKPLPSPAAPPADQLVQTLSGKVAETFKGAGYVYVRLEKDGASTWAAMSGDNQAYVGEEIELKPGMVMTNFKSAALNRSFDRIVFSDGRADVPPAPKKPGKMAAQGVETVSGSLAGRVVETMDAGGYTYVNLESEGERVWVAIPVTKVSVGERLEAQPGMRMDSFTSKSLNRTFDVIYFSSGASKTR